MTTILQRSLCLIVCCVAAIVHGKAPAPERGMAQQAGVSSMRSLGPAGLEKVLRSYDELVAQRKSLVAERDSLRNVTLFGKQGSGTPAKTADARFDELQKQVAALDQRIERVATLVDRVGGQRTCTISRLYWYTDMAAAKQAAAQSGKPILSLRMLGKLTDEYSCANSRFFRTALYSNKDISDFLRANFVLHWESVRPVPRVTIDFGDGRKLERTLTGNSAHYVLASDGTPLDVLPGLYSPRAFRQWSWTMSNFYRSYHDAPPEARAGMLQAFHRGQLDKLLKRWDLDIQQLGAQRAELARLRINAALESARLAGNEAPSAIEAPRATEAFAQAVTKTVTEAPLLRFAKLGGNWMERGMDDELWQGIADYYRADVKLDDTSIELMRGEMPIAAEAARRAVSKTRVEDPILRYVRSFEESMALDTVRNEYMLHRRVHEEFANSAPATADSLALNEWVYAELFLTPSSDPWLGLAPQDVYTALEGDGRTEEAATLVGRADR